MSTRARSHGRRALAPACGLLLLTLPLGPLACGGAGEPSSAATGPVAGGGGPVSTGFESATILAHADSERASLTPDAARAGRAGLELRPTASDAYLRIGADTLGEDHPFWTFRAWMRVPAWTPNESVDLFTVRNLKARNNFDLFVGAPDHELRWDVFRENSAATAAPVVLDRWYLVEAKGSFATSTFTADVRIDGVDQRSIVSPGQTPSAVKDFVLGSLGTAKTHRAQFDDVRVELADAPLPFLGPPRPGARS